MDQIVSYPATEETYDGKGGLKIFFRSWRPRERRRAVVVICHGVNSHGGQYIWTAEQFVKSGYAVYALDLRGRGKSEGERFYVEDDRRLRRRRRRRDQDRQVARSRPAGLPARPQRRRRHRQRLHPRQPVGARRLHLRELRLPGAGARASRWPRSRASATSHRACRCSRCTTRTSRAIRRRWRRSTTIR